MSLIDEYMKQPAAKETTPDLRVEFDGTHGHIEVGPNNNPNDYADILREANLDPEQYEIVGTPGLSRLIRDGDTMQTWYKLKLRLKGHGVDPRELEEELAAAPIPAIRPVTEGAWFHFQVGDIHLGKSADAGGGSEQIIHKYLESLALARAEFDTLPDIAGVCLSYVGDLVEGYTSQNGKNIAQQDMTLTEQIRVGRRLMLRAVDTFLDTGLPIRVHAIGGNHDETTRVQNVKPGDNHAVDAAVALADAMELSPAYRNVEVVVPPDTQGHMTVPVGDTRVTYVHGHNFASGSVENKIQKWWSGQALNNRPAGSSHVLCAGHFHSFRWLQISADKTAIMSPSMELESAWFAESTGARSKRGAVTYTTNAGTVSRVSVL